MLTFTYHLLGLEREFHSKDTTSMTPEPNHIRY